MLSYRGTNTVHGRIPATQNHHALAFQVHIVFGRLLKTKVVIYVADQIGQCLVDTRQILAREISAHIFVGSHTQEHGVILFKQLRQRNVPAYFGIEFELNTHALKHFATKHHNVFFELKFGNAKGQQAANFRVAIKHGCLDPRACKNIRTAQPRWACANNRNLLIRFYNPGEVRAPSHSQRGVSNVLL